MVSFGGTDGEWILGDLDGREESRETNYARRAEFGGRMELGVCGYWGILQWVIVGREPLRSRTRIFMVVVGFQHL